MNSDSSLRKKTANRRGISPPARAKRPVAERHALPALQPRSRATRARILAAAEEIFAESGYDGARLSDIAEHAECSVGAVYFRFKDKNALFLAIAESFVEDARSRAVMPDSKACDWEFVVRRFVADTGENFRRHKGLFRAIVERGIDHPQVMATIFALRDELANRLMSALSGKSTTKGDLSLQIRVLTQMVYGFLLAGVLNPRAPVRIADRAAIGELENACIAYLRSNGAAS